MLQTEVELSNIQNTHIYLPHKITFNYLANIQWAGVLRLMLDLEIAREGLHYVGDTIWTNTSSRKEIEDYGEIRVGEM